MDFCSWLLYPLSTPGMDERLSSYGLIVWASIEYSVPFLTKVFYRTICTTTPEKLTDQVQRGEFEDVEREDVLQMVLKKKEQSGGVCVAGYGVYQSNYYGSLTSKKEYTDQIAERNARVKLMEHEIEYFYDCNVPS